MKTTEFRDTRTIRSLPVRELTEEECRRLLVHNHGGGLSPERRKAYLLKGRLHPEAFFKSKAEMNAIRRWIQQEPDPRGVIRQPLPVEQEKPFPIEIMTATFGKWVLGYAWVNLTLGGRRPVPGLALYAQRESKEPKRKVVFSLKEAIGFFAEHKVPAKSAAQVTTAAEAAGAGFETFFKPDKTHR